MIDEVEGASRNAKIAFRHAQTRNRKIEILSRMVDLGGLDRLPCAELGENLQNAIEMG